MRISIFLTGLFFSLNCLVSTANAGLLSQSSWGIGQGAIPFDSSGPIDTTSLSFQWGDYDFNDSGLFNLVVTENDIGKRFSFDSGIDFDTTVSWLNNGVNDQSVYICSAAVNGASCPGGSESELFLGFDPLAHFNIESIDFIIRDLWFKTPGEDPNGDGFWVDTEITFDIEIFGTEVPEPSAWILFSLVFLGLQLSKRVTGHLS